MQTFEAPVSNRQEKVKQARKTVDEHLAELADAMRQGKSAELVRYLDFFAQFHQYSFGNLMLAYVQRPNMTQLAGLKQWNKLGRTVIPGEHGIMILAPMKVKRAELEALEVEENKSSGRTPVTKSERPSTAKRSNGQEIVTYYRPVYVFDISQTRGEEVPTIIHAKGDAKALQRSLDRVLKHSPFELEYVSQIKSCPGALGVSLGARIQVLNRLEGADRFRVVVHEYGHEILRHHSSELNKQIREIEADATAYVVCKHFGIDCDTSDYLLLYDVKPELLYERMEDIRRVSSLVISQLESDLEVLAQWQGK